MFQLIARFFKTFGGFRPEADTITGFCYEGSSESFTSDGKIKLLFESDGWIFEPIVGQGGQTVSFVFEHLRSNQYWNLDFAAPKGAVISVGTFKDASSYPSRTFNEPGLSFTGSGRADSELVGEFTVLEVELRGNRVVRFAADFIQHDERDKKKWNRGSIRYRSHIPLDSNSKVSSA